jgi:hypothetical protein
MNKRIIAVFTGNRAEYGLQYPILRAIDRHPDLDYRLLVSGAHLDSNFGGTLEEIRADGFHIDAEVKIEMDAGSLFATAQAIGSGGLCRPLRGFCCCDCCQSDEHSHRPYRGWRFDRRWCAG